MEVMRANNVPRDSTRWMTRRMEGEEIYIRAERTFGPDTGSFKIRFEWTRGVIWDELKVF